MKRTLVAALLAGMLGIVAISPALATLHMPARDICPHDSTIASLQACVDHMQEQGFIDNAGIGKSLKAKLNAAQSAADREQPDVAANKLEALVDEVEAQAGKHIAEPHAGHLLQHAQMVIDALAWPATT